MVCRSVYPSVCPLVMFVSPAKTAEPIEMPFGWADSWRKKALLDGSRSDESICRQEG